MDIQYVKSASVQEIDHQKIEKYVPLEQVYGDGIFKLQELRLGANPNDVQRFLHDCRNFLIEGIVQIKQRFDLKQEF